MTEERRKVARIGGHCARDAARGRRRRGQRETHCRYVSDVSEFCVVALDVPSLKYDGASASQFGPTDAVDAPI